MCRAATVTYGQAATTQVATTTRDAFMSDEVRRAEFSKELAQIALSMQSERTGHTPKAVTVVASEETVVLTLHEALTPAEKILARSESGAAKV